MAPRHGVAASVLVLIACAGRPLPPPEVVPRSATLRPFVRLEPAPWHPVPPGARVRTVEPDPRVERGLADHLARAIQGEAVAAAVGRAMSAAWPAGATGEPVPVEVVLERWGVEVEADGALTWTIAVQVEVDGGRPVRRTCRRRLDPGGDAWDAVRGLAGATPEVLARQVQDLAAGCGVRLAEAAGRRARRWGRARNR